MQSKLIRLQKVKMSFSVVTFRVRQVERRPREESKPNGEPLSDDDYASRRPKEALVRRHEQAHTVGAPWWIKYDYTRAKRKNSSGWRIISPQSWVYTEATITKIPTSWQTALVLLNHSADRCRSLHRRSSKADPIWSKKAEAAQAKRSEVVKMLSAMKAQPNAAEVNKAEANLL